MPADEYFSTILPDFRKRLLALDLSEGLSLCMNAYLRDDLSIASLIDDRSHQETWGALQSVSPFSDPFSTLAALDLALDRCEADDRFRQFAELAVERLTTDRFAADGLADQYVLFPQLALAVEDRLSNLEGAMTRPPFWRRLCAYSHTSWLAGRLELPEPQLTHFCKWLQGQYNLSHRVSELLDLRVEPMWLSSALSADGLRGEVLGRLALVVDRHRRNGVDIPSPEKISIALSQSDEKAGTFARSYPGPLEGHRRPAEIGQDRLLDEENSSEIANQLIDGLSSAKWAATAKLTDIVTLPGSLLAKMTELVAARESAGTIQERRLGLISAGLVAARHRHQELADALAVHCLNEAPKVQNVHDIDTLFTTILIASAAMKDREAWAAWLEPNLFSFAQRLPTIKGPELDWIAHALARLKTLAPRGDICRRAIATIDMLP